MINKKNIIDDSKKYFDLNFKKKTFIPGKTYIPASGKVLDATDCANLIDASL